MLLKLFCSITKHVSRFYYIAYNLCLPQHKFSMKNKIVSLLVIALAVVGMFAVSSCESGGSRIPTIYFRVRTDSVTALPSYLSLPRDTIFTIYVNASKTGSEGMLKNFKIARSINGSADSTILDAQINTQYFGQYYSFQAGDSGQVQQYTFTVGNSEGLYNSIVFVDTAR